MRTGARLKPCAHRLESLDRAGAEVRPDHVGEHAEQSIHAGAVWLDQTVREQMQAQVSVIGIDGLVFQRANRGAYQHLLDATIGV
ncbi:Uncharacterised protein [Mycobacteroides abscessus subsp. massiliense]|nr:Uncharacterised protein [Mycobacteroides abscessus subsp. massiliense]